MMDKPILFNTKMVRAILDVKKTMVWVYDFQMM